MKPSNLNPMLTRLTILAAALAVACCSPAPTVAAQRQNIRDTYTKLELRIPMRDGVKLHTVLYIPKNATAKSPIMLERTPYSAGPYGPERFTSWFGGSSKFIEAGYIFATQDVRGRFMSEGKFEEIRPQLLRKIKPEDIDESTDTYDTVDYLIKNVPNNNGRVGLWGISYPGFYAGMAGVNTHPAIKAISPQAPVAEWFLGDDVHHNGAFFLQENFDFYFWFGYDKPGPAEEHPQIEPMPRRADAYTFFLELGSAINADKKYFKGRYPFWLDICNHDAMDEFWQSRSMPPQLKNVKCAVLTVGGWFDAEDCYGALDTYRHAERQNPGIDNWLVMGPWSHGQWAGGSANRLGMWNFGPANLGQYYREEIEFPFFDTYLRGNGKLKRPEAEVFETGNNKWRTFAEWPPKARTARSLYFTGAGKAGFTAPAGVGGKAEDSYVSDPANPVPYMPRPLQGRNSGYMVADQRFLDDRKDVISYVTEPLTQDLTIAGPIDVDLFVTCSGTDADFVVKVIDQQPADAAGNLANAKLMLRGDVMRAKFRNSWQNPRPLKPGAVEKVSFQLNDVLHTFKKGHRIMIQVQSSWFPLVDRNTHKFQNLYYAEPGDYQKATIAIQRKPGAASRVTFGVLP